MAATGTVERYQALLGAARCFGRAMDMGSLIDDILRRAEEVMQAEACSILLPDLQTGELVLHSTDPRVAQRKQPLRVPAGAGIAGAVFETKKAVNLKDARNDPRHYSAVSSQVGLVTRALLSIPLLEGERCLGVMQALNPKGREWFDVEDEEIFEGFGALIVNALLRLEAQRREVEEARVRQQLRLAKEIQDSFLPAPLNVYPYCQVRHHHLPAHTVSGDFGFIHVAGPGRLLVGLADVCGKGIPAALTMARATAIIDATSDQISDLGVWLNCMNRLLCRELKAGRFIGLTLLLADAPSGKLQLCTAGQYAPVHSNGQAWQTVAVPNHLPLGISPTASYKVHEVELRRGDFWLLFTDGLPEARNPEGEEFTVDTFLKSLPVGQTAAATLSGAFTAWSGFRQSAQQHDDASLLLLDWRGPAPAAELSLECCPSNLAALRQYTESWSAFAGFGDIATGQIVMACDEACTNIFRHAYGGHTGPLRLCAEIADNALTFWIFDEAPPVAAEEIRCRELADLRPGGLGTYVMRQVFDEVNYAPHQAGNALTLRKKLA